MQTCSSCHAKKPILAFMSRYGKPTKACDTCRARGAKKFRKHYKANAAAIIKRTRKWKEKNPEAFRKAKRSNDARYAKRHPGKRAVKNRRYRERHPGKHVARVQAYNATKVRATPGWADKAAIEKIYELAQFMRTLAPNTKVEVDHEVPLKSKLVCGLHCPANLRIVVGAYNARKGNRTWRDMP